jgi:hypothetical protein
LPLPSSPLALSWRSGLLARSQALLLVDCVVRDWKPGALDNWWGGYL